MRWRGASVALAIVVAALMAEACSFGSQDTDELLGRWRVTSINGTDVVVGVNTAQQPAFTFERRDGKYLAGDYLVYTCSDN